MTINIFILIEQSRLVFYSRVVFNQKDGQGYICEHIKCLLGSAPYATYCDKSLTTS